VTLLDSPRGKIVKPSAILRVESWPKALQGQKPKFSNLLIVAAEPTTHKYYLGGGFYIAGQGNTPRTLSPD
jgi:hypothetical protein